MSDSADDPSMGRRARSPLTKRRVSFPDNELVTKIIKMRVDQEAVLARSPESVITTPGIKPSPMELPVALESRTTTRVRSMGVCATSASVIALVLSAQFVDGLIAFVEPLPSVSIELMGSLLAGFLAQLVDGALGMGFGVTSTTIMVTVAGLSPLAASTSVHLAQLGTTALSGISHYKCSNVDLPTFGTMAVPGMLGAIGGAMLLASMSSHVATRCSSGLLFALGVYIIHRFSRAGSRVRAAAARPSPWLLWPLAACGGVVDATGGGGWGPVATTGLLADGSLSPSLAVGTVSAVEFLVTISAVLGFLSQLGWEHLLSGGRPDLAGALLVGGLAGAPIAPLLVRKLHPTTLGLTIGGFICLTNARTLLCAVRCGAEIRMWCYAGITLAWLMALVRAPPGEPGSASESGGVAPSPPRHARERRGLASLRLALDNYRDGPHRDE